MTLDSYWPNTTELTCIKRIPGKAIYTAQYNGEEVIVKSITYSAEIEETTIEYGSFINFIDEKVSVAGYIDPSVEHSEDMSLLVTVSRFASGVSAYDLEPTPPTTWITDENAVKTIGTFWKEFRGRSIEYKAAYPESYEKFPEWDTIQDGW